MARIMFVVGGLLKTFWDEAINIACYIINRCMIRPLLEKTSYDLLKGCKPNIIHLRTFDSKCFMHHNDKNALEFDIKSDEGVFLRYFSHIKA